MLNPHNHPTLFGYRLHGTTLALTSSSLGPNHPGEDTFGNSHAAIGATLSLRSTSLLPSQIQAFPMSRHLVSHHHMGEIGYRSSYPITPHGLHVQSTPNFQPQPQKTVNLNIIMGRNSSININALNNKPHYQLVRNNLFATSSSIPLVRNNVYDPASSYPHHPFIILDSNQETITSRSLESNERSQFTRHHSQYASPIVATMNGASLRTREDPAIIPCLRQNTISLSPHQGRPSQPCQGISCENQPFSQSESGLSLFNQQSRCFPTKGPNHVPPLPNSTLNPTKNQVLTPHGCHSIFHENSFHTQSNLPASLENHPAMEEVSEFQQASEPNFNHYPLLQTELLQVPSQSSIKNATIDLDTRARRCHHSPTRLRSHPYIKYGPYTCPQCHEIFENGYRFAAHVQKHYKDETPAQRKKRRECKIKSRDLHIAQSMNGITVLPGSTHMQDEPYAANIGDGKVNKINHGEDIIIKKEI